jgi:hypothetical protein
MRQINLTEVQWDCLKLILKDIMKENRAPKTQMAKELLQRIDVPYKSNPWSKPAHMPGMPVKCP